MGITGRLIRKQVSRYNRCTSMNKVLAQNSGAKVSVLLILASTWAKMWVQGAINFKGIEINMLKMKSASTPPF